MRQPLARLGSRLLVKECLPWYQLPPVRALESCVYLALASLGHSSFSAKSHCVAQPDLQPSWHYSLHPKLASCMQSYLHFAAGLIYGLVTAKDVGRNAKVCCCCPVPGGIFPCLFRSHGPALQPDHRLTRVCSDWLSLVRTCALNRYALQTCAPNSDVCTEFLYVQEDTWHNHEHSDWQIYTRKCTSHASDRSQQQCIITDCHRIAVQLVGGLFLAGKLLVYLSPIAIAYLGAPLCALWHFSVDAPMCSVPSVTSVLCGIPPLMPLSALCP